MFKMLIVYATLLLSIVYTVNTGWVHGKCPKPKLTPDSAKARVKFPSKGTWYALFKNSDLIPEPKKAKNCFKMDIQETKGKFTGTFSYTDGYGKHKDEVKFVADARSPTLLDVVSKNVTAIDEEPYSWRFTPVAFEDKFVIEQICKEGLGEVTLHTEFYAIFGLDKKIPEAVAKKLKKYATDEGDKRSFVARNQDKC